MLLGIVKLENKETRELEPYWRQPPAGKTAFDIRQVFKRAGEPSLNEPPDPPQIAGQPQEWSTRPEQAHCWRCQRETTHTVYAAQLDSGCPVEPWLKQCQECEAMVTAEAGLARWRETAGR